MPLNTENRTPLYHQIYLILRSKILNGEYGPGDYIPGERELEETFQVSRITAVRALNDLAKQGLVVRERGRGTRVQIASRGIIARGPASEATIAPQDATPTEGTRGRAFDSHRTESIATVHEFGYIKAKRPVAEALRLNEGDIVQHSVRTWRVKGEKPFSYLVTYVPEEISRYWGKADLEKQRLSKLLTRQGINVARVQEEVTATLVDIVLSQHLEVAAGSPILRIRRLVFDERDRPIEFVTGFYPSDRYHYEVTLMHKGGQRWESI